MATRAESMPARRTETFFLRSAIVMTIVLVAGFSLQLGAGRSTFAAPWPVHLHALVFMGWMVIYLAQNVFAATGARARHRRLGWLATGWVVAMVVMGCWVTIAIARRGMVPFFFTPIQFLALDILSLFGFAGLIAAGIVNRRRTDWHRRLNFCAMTLLLGPGIGRLLPMPFLIPFAFEATLIPILAFPIAGMIADVRRNGRIHPAWHWGMAAILGYIALTELFAHTPVGVPIYNALTAGSPGATVAPFEFAAPPDGHLITGRRTSI